MLKIIKNADVYAPEYIGKKDILIEGKTIGVIQDEINMGDANIEFEIINADGKILVPGFIDTHVHILGGGGEGSYKTRTPELVLSTMVESGVTTVVGCIGTDGITRSMKSLIAKAKSLKEEGVTCYVYTGSYDVPVRTLMGNIKEDIILIEEIIGVGEIAISDHRSSQPTIDEIKKIAADARVAGMLSGKAGVVNIHMGDGADKLKMLEEIVATTTLPISQFIPTHVNRSASLFEAGIHYAKNGGHVDLTICPDPAFMDADEVKCSSGLKQMLDSGVDIEKITFTSDGQGSLPVFNEKGELTGLGVGKMDYLIKEVIDAVKHENIPLETAIKVITSNPAKKFKFSQKGIVAQGKDADLVLLDKQNYEIDTVIAMGRTMMANKKILVKGTFE